ncbi:hypothetical protein DYB36_008581, partial [Aphanomyces astaci]
RRLRNILEFAEPLGPDDIRDRIALLAITLLNGASVAYAMDFPTEQISLEDPLTTARTLASHKERHLFETMLTGMPKDSTLSRQDWIEYCALKTVLAAFADAQRKISESTSRMKKENVALLRLTGPLVAAYRSKLPSDGTPRSPPRREIEPPPTR